MGCAGGILCFSYTYTPLPFVYHHRRCWYVVCFYGGANSESELVESKVPVELLLHGKVVILNGHVVWHAHFFCGSLEDGEEKTQHNYRVFSKDPSALRLLSQTFESLRSYLDRRALLSCLLNVGSFNSHPPIKTDVTQPSCCAFSKSGSRFNSPPPIKTGATSSNMMTELAILCFNSHPPIKTGATADIRTIQKINRNKKTFANPPKCTSHSFARCDSPMCSTPNNRS